MVNRVLAFALVLALAGDSLPIRAVDKKELLKQAQAAEAQKDFEAAESLYCQLQKADHGNKTARQKCEEYGLANRDASARDEFRMNQGRAAFNEGRFADAQDHFRAIQSKKFLAEANRYLNELIPAGLQKARDDAERKERERREADERARTAEANAKFQSGVEAYQKNDFIKARDLLSAASARQPGAQEYLTKMEQYESAFNHATEASRAGRKEAALKQFSQALKIKPDGPWDVKGKVAALQAELHAPATSQEPSSDERLLFEGITAYYKGSFQEAETKLSAYNGEPRLRALAFFYLGASELSRYYLAGVTDQELLRSAKGHFALAKQSAPTFVPPSPYVSPKIVKVFAEAPAM